MVVIKRFRTVWGVESGDDFQHWIPWFPELKKEGFGWFYPSDVILHRH